MRWTLPATLLAGAALGLAPLPAAGQRAIERGETIAAPAPQAWSLTLGALAAVRPDYQGSDDYDPFAAPLIDLRFRDRFFLSSRDGIGVTAIRVGGFAVGPLLRYQFGRDQDDNAALRGLGDVGGTVEVGVFLNWRSGPWVINANAVQGLNGGGHRGATAFVSLGYGERLSEAWSYSFGPSLAWASDSYMQAFFGVTPEQSLRSGYAPFSAGAGIRNVGFAATLTWRVAERTAVTALAEVSELLGDAADSPIVDRAGAATQGFAGLALSYRFSW
jgi:outer membrane protein